MANIYDVASAIKQPDVVGSFQQGVQTARTNAAQNIALQQAQQQQADTQTLRGLAPQIIGGDPNAYAQAAALNPDQANAYQAAGNSQLTRIRGALNYLDQQPTDQAKEAAFQSAVRPYLQGLASQNGHTVPNSLAEAQPGIDALRAQVSQLGPGQTHVLTPGAAYVGEGGQLLYNNPAADKVVNNAPIGPNGEKGVVVFAPHSGGAGQIATLGGGTGAPSGMASPDFYNAVNGIASEFGGTITSGVRDAQHNAEVGGVPNSQHVTGTAADVVIPADQKAAAIAKGKALGLQPIDEGDHIHFQNPNGGAGVSGVRLAVGTPVQKPSSLQNRIDIARALGATDDDLKSLALGHGNAPADSGLSDAAVRNLSWQYALNGTLPPVGRGGAGQAQRTAVINATADLAKEFGVSPQELATTAGRNKAFQSSLSNTQKQTDTIDRSSETFHKNADLMQSLADQVQANGPQAWNQFVIGVKNKVTTDPTVAAYLAAQQTASQEYAKVASGATGAAGSTDSAREHANAVINAFQTPDQLRAVLSTLRQDTENQRQVAHDKLTEIRGNMQQFGTSGSAKPTQTTGTAADIQSLLDKYGSK